MKKVALLTVFLVGCTTMEVTPKGVCDPIPIIDPPMPPPIVLNAPEFYVVSNENREAFDMRIQRDSNGVFYAITPSGYTILAENMQELRRYIRELQQVVIYYREYEESINQTKPD